MPVQLVDDTFLCEPPRSLVLRDGFGFHHGKRIAPFTIVYETYGTLNADRSNAILVCHALSPGAHCAGKYAARGREARLVGRHDRPRQGASISRPSSWCA